MPGSNCDAKPPSDGLLAGAEAPAREDEGVDTEAPDRLDLRGSISDAAILAEDRKTQLPAQLEPLYVGDVFVALAVDLVMGAQRPAGRAQGLGTRWRPRLRSRKNSRGRWEGDTQDVLDVL
jgi:hypothetical protein